jgi:hypothetical protein
MSQINMQDILDRLTEETYNPYGIWKVLNEILKENGAKEIRPQMMYNYAANGLIVSRDKIAKENLRPITKDEVATFLKKYCEKRDLRIVQVQNPDQLELDLEI